MPLDSKSGASPEWPPQNPQQQPMEEHAPQPALQPPRQAAPQPQQRPVQASAPRPGLQIVPVNTQRAPGNQVYVGRRPVPAAPTPPQGPPVAPGAAHETAYEQPERKSRVGKVVLSSMLVVVLGAGAAGADEVFNRGRTLAKLGIGTGADRGDFKSPWETSAQASQSEDEPTEEPSESPSPTPTPSTPSPTPTPTPTEKAVVPPVVLTAAECAPETPTKTKINQLLMFPITEKTDLAALAKKQAASPMEYIVMSYPKNADGSLNVAGVNAVKNANKALPAMMAIDQEGGKVARIADPKLMGPDQLSAGKVTAKVLGDQLAADYKILKDSGITVNLAPIADVLTPAVAGKESGRMFRSIADANKYFPVYNEFAKASGINLTYKHFPNLLGAYAAPAKSGNTDVAPVKTQPYATILKSGALNVYKQLQDTHNLAMMSSATTPGWQNIELDNKKINVLNPAAYDALAELTKSPEGEHALVITDDLGAKAVTSVVSVDLAPGMAIAAGADIAMVVNPATGKSIADEKVSVVAAIEAGIEDKTIPLATIDTAFLRVLGNKGLNACNVLKSVDKSAYKKLMKAKQAEAAKKASATPAPKPSAESAIAPKPTASSKATPKATATSN